MSDRNGCVAVLCLFPAAWLILLGAGRLGGRPIAPERPESSIRDRQNHGTRLKNRRGRLARAQTQRFDALVGDGGGRHFAAFQLDVHAGNGNADAVLLQRLVVRTTARNQLFGSISEIQKGAAHAEVLLKLNGGDKVSVTVTMASLDELGIRIGADAVLLINSSDVLLTTDSEPERFCASNRFQCRILRLHQDTADSEAIVLLPGGEILVAMITRQSIMALGLVPGMTVWAMFKANAPILGIRSPSR
ncbi:MAG: TOBE domain-containing protein [Methylosarcina sp.]